MLYTCYRSVIHYHTPFHIVTSIALAHSEHLSITRFPNTQNANDHNANKIKLQIKYLKRVMKRKRENCSISNQMCIKCAEIKTKILITKILFSVEFVMIFKLRNLFFFLSNQTLFCCKRCQLFAINFNRIFFSYFGICSSMAVDNCLWRCTEMNLKGQIKGIRRKDNFKWFFNNDVTDYR